MKVLNGEKVRKRGIRSEQRKKKQEKSERARDRGGTAEGREKKKEIEGKERYREDSPSG